MDLARIVEADYVTIPIDKPGWTLPLRTSKRETIRGDAAAA